MNAGSGREPGEEAGGQAGAEVSGRAGVGTNGQAGVASLVVKIGGSLSREGRAADVLAEVTAATGGSRGGSTLVLSGGGAEVDEVRDAARRGEIEGDDAYWAAVRALDRMAAALVSAYEATHGPGDVQLCGDILSCRRAREEGRVPVLTPYPVIRPIPDFPVDWEMTSDSIAAWMAYRVDAADLVLAKARPPRSAAPPGEDGVPTVPASSVAAESLVDAFLPRFVSRSGYPATCWIVDGSRPGRVASWLGGDRSAGVRVQGDG